MYGVDVEHGFEPVFREPRYGCEEVSRSACQWDTISNHIVGAQRRVAGCAMKERIRRQGAPQMTKSIRPS